MDKNKGVDIWYQRNTNTVTIGAPQSAFDPTYLKYMLQYLGIPENATILFVSKMEDTNDNT
jgi:hypothetical protein